MNETVAVLTDYPHCQPVTYTVSHRLHGDNWGHNRSDYRTCNSDCHGCNLHIFVCKCFDIATSEGRLIELNERVILFYYLMFSRQHIMSLFLCADWSATSYIAAYVSRYTWCLLMCTPYSCAGTFCTCTVGVVRLHWELISTWTLSASGVASKVQDYSSALLWHVLQKTMVTMRDSWSSLPDFQLFWPMLCTILM